MNITPSDCLMRALRDRAKAEGYSSLNMIATADLSFYASQLYDCGEGARCRAVAELRKLEEAGRAALESEVGQ